MATGPAPSRIAAVAAAGFGGVVVPAVTFGAIAGRFAPADRAVLVTALVTSAVALLAGVLVEPFLRRSTVRPHKNAQTGPAPGPLPRRRL